MKCYYSLFLIIIVFNYFAASAFGKIDKCENQPLVGGKNEIYLRYYDNDCILSEFDVSDEVTFNGVMYCGKVFEKDSVQNADKNLTLQFDDHAIEVEYSYSVKLTFDHKFVLDDGSLQKYIQHIRCPNAKGALPEKIYGYILDLRPYRNVCFGYRAAGYVSTPKITLIQSVEDVSDRCISDEHVSVISKTIGNKPSTSASGVKEIPKTTKSIVPTYTKIDKCENQPLVGGKNEIYLRYYDKDCILSEFDVSDEVTFNGVMYCGKVFEKDSVQNADKNLTLQFDDHAIEVEYSYSVKLTFDHKFVLDDGSLQKYIQHIRCPNAKGALPEKIYGYILDLRPYRNVCFGYRAAGYVSTPKITLIQSVEDVSDRCISDEHVSVISKTIGNKPSTSASGVKEIPKIPKTTTIIRTIKSVKSIAI